MHELIQSEIQSDIISEKSLSFPAEVFRFRSVKYNPPPRETRQRSNIIRSRGIFYFDRGRSSSTLGVYGRAVTKIFGPGSILIMTNMNHLSEMVRVDTQ